MRLRVRACFKELRLHHSFVVPVLREKAEQGVGELVVRTETNGREKGLDTPTVYW